MVRNIIPALVMLAVTASVAAAPAPEASVAPIANALSANATNFLVSDWLESYIKKDPEATKLDEVSVVEKKTEAVVAAEGSSLTKRGTCTSIFPAADVCKRKRRI